MQIIYQGLVITVKCEKNHNNAFCSSNFKSFFFNLTTTEECYLIRQDNTIYKFSIKLSYSSIGQDKSKIQKTKKSKFLN